MRFGLPAGPNLAVITEPAHVAFLSDSSQNTSHEPDQASPSQSASQILNEFLGRLEASYIRKCSISIKEKTKEWERFLERSTSMANSNMSYVDQEFDRDIRALRLDVQRIIEHQIRLQEEEKQRLLALEQERQPKEKEELERRKHEQEAAQKRLEEQRKHAERTKLAEHQRLAEELRLRTVKEAKEEKKEVKRKSELLRLKAQKESAARKTGFVSSNEIENALLKYRQDIKDIKDNVVGDLEKDKELKKSVGAIKRKVNVKLGQLSNSRRQLESVTNEVLRLIQPLTSHPVAYKWLLNFVLKAIVSQAETEVTVKPAAALPLGKLAYTLLRCLDGLEYYLSARFVKKCCLVIGYTGTLDTEESRIRMGWKRSDGKWESEVKYEERIGGILSVWAVVGWENTTTNFLLFNMRAEWRFVARILNTNPELLGDVHFVAVCNWWEAAAEKFHQTFGEQAKKVLRLVVGEWAARGTQRGFPAATRLQILGEDLFQKGRFNSLKEMEP